MQHDGSRHRLGVEVGAVGRPQVLDPDPAVPAVETGMALGDVAVVREGQLYVEDLGSTNGTYLNRQKVTAPIAMRKGDQLQVGKTVLELT